MTDRDVSEVIHLVVYPNTYEAIVNCLAACAGDEREPERYREWYAEALAEVQRQRGAAMSTDGESRYDGREGR